MDSGNGPRPASTAPANANARDLGYLDKFLDKLKSQAAAMPRGDARTRLEVLLNEETDRWREITSLLGGAIPVSSTAPHPTPQRPVATPSAPQQRPNPGARPAWKPRVTIGSLKQSKS